MPLRLLSLVLVVGVVGCSTFYEIPIETPIAAKLDVSAFQRVFIAGFLAGGTEDVDGNLETVRLLRSQLRTKSDLRVVEADVLPLMEVAVGNSAPLAASSNGSAGSTNGSGASTNGSAASEPELRQDNAAPEIPAIKTEKDLEPLEQIFANADYWKRIGEEYQNPLIVTGSVVFAPHSRSGFVQREQEVMDALGRRRVVPVRAYQERKGFILVQKFVFIDGRTGATLHSANFREERLYSQSDSTPALSSYFELMDEIIPQFLSTLSTQKVRGTRVLIK